MFKTTLMALSFCVLSAGVAADAKAEQYGCFILENPTNQTLHYQIKWGENSPWESRSIPPKTDRAHYIPLDSNGQAPVPYIRFDYIAGDGRTTPKTYMLEFYGVYDIWDGLRYVFRYSPSGKFLDLYEKH